MIHTMDTSIRLSTFRYQEILRSFDEPVTRSHWQTDAFAGSGITTLTLFEVVRPRFHACYMRLYINPCLIMTGQLDPNALFDETDFAEMIPPFNGLVHEFIDSRLPSLEDWTVSRIDYAADAFIDSNINPQRYVVLAKQGQLPPCTELDTDHPEWISYTAENGSCRVRVYHRGPAVRAKYPGLPEAVYQYADHTLRLEVECHEDRIGSIKTRKNFPDRQVQHFLTHPEIAREELSRQARRIFDEHDYFSLNMSTPRISSSNFQKRTQNDLRAFLKSVQVAGGLQKAQNKWNQGQAIPYRYNKQRFAGRVFSPAQFRRITGQLRQLEINPVPLPIGWKPGHFPHPFPVLI